MQTQFVAKEIVTTLIHLYMLGFKSQKKREK